MAEGQILDAIEENVPEEAEQDEWNWEALAKFVNTRWKLNLRDRDLKKIGRDTLDEMLLEKAREAIEATDLSQAERVLEDGFGVRSACGWVQFKFGVQLDPEEMKSLDARAFTELVRSRRKAAYEEKEAEFPVRAALSHFTARDRSRARSATTAISSWPGPGSDSRSI